MAEIKSFRKYIAEQEENKLLKENNESNDIDNLSNENNKKDEKDAPVSATSRREKPETAKIPQNATVLPVTDTEIELSGKSQQKQIEELSNKVQLLYNTYRNLDQYVTHYVKKAENKIEAKGLDITHGRSFAREEAEWKEEFEKLKPSAEEYLEIFNKIKDLNKFRIFRSEKRKEHEKKLYNELLAKGLRTEDAEPSDDIISESPIDLIRNLRYKTTSRRPRLSNPFKTTSELSTGTGNKFNAKRALTTLEKSRKYSSDDNKLQADATGTTSRTYSDALNDYVKDLTAKYMKDGRAIISKEQKDGVSYLNRATAQLDKYNKYNRWIKDPSNYITNIAIDVKRSMSIVQSIGRYLERLIQEYHDALYSITNELKVRSRKTENADNDLNATSTLRKAQTRIAKWEKQKEDDEVYRAANDAQKKEGSSESEQTPEEIENQTWEAKKSDELAIEKFFDYLKAHQPNEITKDSLVSKISKDLQNSRSGKQRTELDKRSDLKATILLAKYLTNGKLKDFRFGEEATHTKQEEAGALSILERLDNQREEFAGYNSSIEGTALMAKRILGADTEEEANNLSAQEAADKLNKEAGFRKKINDYVDVELVTELKRLKSYLENKPSVKQEDKIKEAYEFVYKRIHSDIKNPGKYSNKSADSNSDKLTATERRKASAIISSMLLYFIKNNLLDNALREIDRGSKTLNPNLTYTPFKEAFDDIKKTKINEIKNYNIGLEEKLPNNSKAISAAFKEKLTAQKPNPEETAQRALTGIKTNAAENKGKKSGEKEDDNSKATGTYGKPRSAKDFDGEEPQQPKSIYDYAIQKAKKLQER